MLNAPHPALYLRPEMVHELALGLDPPMEIAGKYGVTPAEFTQLQSEAWFNEAIFRKREELHANGTAFSVKAAMMSEEMWQDIYLMTKTQDVRIEHRIEAAKQLSNLAGLVPQKGAGVAASGPAFVIQINVPEQAVGPSHYVKEASQVAQAEPMIIDLKPVDPIPPPPPGLKIPDFNMKDDLVGAPVPVQVEPAGMTNLAAVKWP